MQNWAGNYRFTAARVHEPRTTDEMRAIAARAKKLRVIGTRHSFNDIADCSEGDLVSTKLLDRIISIDSSTATVEAGITYGKLAEQLHDEGFALRNLASLPHISVGGAIATATHGSGHAIGNLSTAVRAMEIINANGEVRQLSRETLGERFDGIVVSLGAIGITTKVTFDIVPTFIIRQQVILNVPMPTIRHSFESIATSAYSVSFFTNWRSDAINQIWFKYRDDERFTLPLDGIARASHDVHPIDGCDAQNCTPQMNVPGPWHERLPHFRMDFTPSSGEELQSEYFVAREDAVDAIDALRSLAPKIAELIQVTEIRTIAADNLWLSPCYRRPSAAIHFTWKSDWNRVAKLLPEIESALAPFNARPHWAKLFAMRAEKLASLYAKMDDFRKLLSECDPHGKFRNEYIRRYIMDG